MEQSPAAKRFLLHFIKPQSAHSSTIYTFTSLSWLNCVISDHVLSLKFSRSLIPRAWVRLQPLRCHFEDILADVTKFLSAVKPDSSAGTSNPDQTQFQPSFPAEHQSTNGLVSDTEHFVVICNKRLLSLCSAGWAWSASCRCSRCRVQWCCRQPLYWQIQCCTAGNFISLPNSWFSACVFRFMIRFDYRSGSHSSLNWLSDSLRDPAISRDSSSVHWSRFCFQLTHVHSTLELSGRCRLQIYLLTCLSVLPSVSLLATLCKKLPNGSSWKILRGVCLWIRKIWSKFWKSSGSRFRSRNFRKDSSSLCDGAFFHSLAHGSRKTDWIFVKILSEMIFRWESPH